ncbi:MAG: NYN domain-containing protein [Candidatus Pacebacteria bacterium]|nr:NYN domain-containing protein [Candidatus Paceibacterota bacterium]
MSLALVLIDWENISKKIREQRYVPERFSRAAALKRLFQWIKDEAGGIFDTFLFAPIFMTYTDYQLLHDNGLFPFTCPKVPLGSPDKKDTVDPALIKKAEKWITHPELTHICLVSGDSDFIPLLKKAKKRGLLVMISALDPALTKGSSLSKELSKMADISPKTGRKMIHYFSPTI